MYSHARIATTMLMFLVFHSAAFAQSQVLDTLQSDELMAKAAKFVKVREKAGANFAKGQNADELIKFLMKKEAWTINEQITFKEYYTDFSCGDFPPEVREYITGSLLVSKKKENLNTPYKFQIMFPLDVVRESGAYISFCNTRSENGVLISDCDANATFVLSYSNCDKGMQVCLVEFDDFNVYKGGEKLNLYGAIKSNNKINIAYHGAHGFRDCAISYLNLKNILR